MEKHLSVKSKNKEGTKSTSHKIVYKKGRSFFRSTGSIKPMWEPRTIWEPIGIPIETRLTRRGKIAYRYGLHFYPKLPYLE